MTRPSRRRAILFAAAGAALTYVAGTAAAHTMVTPYDLPIPFSGYLSACAATLLLTFAVLWLAPIDTGESKGSPGAGVKLNKAIPWVGRAGAIALLGVTVAAGLFGTPSPVANIGPTLFWVGFMLVLTAITALAGDVFQIVNPWRALLEIFDIGGRPRLRYPGFLAYWPAFAFYVALEWLELIAPPRPSILSMALILYTGLTACGAALFGREAWLQRAELFEVFFRTVGTMAPLTYVREHSGTRPVWSAYWRPAFSGALEHPPSDLSLVLFVLFMLAATTFDGVWQTSFWAELYWGNLMQWLRPLWGDDMARAQAFLAPGYLVYQRGGLIAAPFVYLAIYMAVMATVRVVAGGQHTTQMLSLRFAFALVPIAVAYLLAHSLTVILTVIPVVPFLLTDPFGFGWNLLGLPLMSAEPGSLKIGEIWHAEVALILAGHVASVYVAHIVALRVVATRRQAWLCELPLLVLMICYTFVGLAVLSLPLALH